MAFEATLPTVRPALPTLLPADFAFSSTVSRTASTVFPAEPLLAELDERLLAFAAGRDFLVDAGRDLLADADRDLLVDLAFVDLDLEDRLGRVEVELFFV